MFYKNMEVEGIIEEESSPIRSPIHSPRKRLLEDAQKYEDFTRREQEEVKQKRRRINAAEALAMLNSPRASPVAPVGEEMHHGPPLGFFSDDNSSSDDPMATMDVASENPALE